MSVVAVTGSAGFVGGAVCDALEAAGHEVLRVQRRPDALGRPTLVWDITEPFPGSGEPSGDAHAVDVIVHCAGRPGTTDNGGTLTALHVGGTQAVLDAWPGVPVVHVSTAAVYPHAPKLAGGKVVPFAPADAQGEGLHDDYARTKWEGEQVVMSDCAAAGRSAVILRPSLIYGPGDTTFLPGMRKAVWAGRLWLPNAGKGLWSVTPVGLLAAMCADAAGALAAGKTTGVRVENAVSPEPIALGELARKELSAELGRELKLASIPGWLVNVIGWANETAFKVFAPGKDPVVTRAAAGYVMEDRLIEASRG